MSSWIKKCSKCNKVKNSDEFYSHNQCKVCIRDLVKQNSKTKSGLITRLFSDTRSIAKQKGLEYPSYTKEEFKTFLTDSKTFHELYNKWVKDDYKTKSRPSINRIDFTKSFDIDNIVLVSYEVSRHRKIERKVRPIKKARVSQYTVLGQKVESFPSIAEASRQTGISYNKIRHSLNDTFLVKNDSPFDWKYD